MKTAKEGLREGGVSTALVDFYSKWRRGNLTTRTHWPNWNDYVDDLTDQQEA